MSGWGHERRFRDVPGTSASPPRPAVKADIPDRQLRAKTGRGPPTREKKLWRTLQLEALRVRVPATYIPEHH